jgi:hypothetical protein
MNPIDMLSLAASILGLIIALVTLYVAWRIPHQIMISQRYTELLSEYRTTEMGDAIYSILDFFVNECGKDANKITEKYKALFKNEIEKNRASLEYEPSKTLHFKRRLVDHFFWLLGDIMFNRNYPIKIPREQIRRYFTANERHLLLILERMNRAARSKECWLDASAIENDKCECSSDSSSPMTEYRKKLLEESKQWK